MEHFYTNIDGYLRPNNLFLLDRVIKSLPKNNIWVELGSWTGQSAAYCAVELINQEKFSQFFCVDTWEGSENTNQKLMKIVQTNSVFNVFENNLKPILDKIKTIKSLSWEAAQTFKDNSVDFVYVDADHRYESVLKDLNAWYGKIKPGCYFGGDDFTKGHPGVQKAVKDFFTHKNVKVTKLGRCWFVRKP